MVFFLHKVSDKSLRYEHEFETTTKSQVQFNLFCNRYVNWLIRQQSIIYTYMRVKL